MLGMDNKFAWCIRQASHLFVPIISFNTYNRVSHLFRFLVIFFTQCLYAVLTIIIIESNRNGINAFKKKEPLILHASEVILKELDQTQHRMVCMKENNKTTDSEASEDDEQNV